MTTDRAAAEAALTAPQRRALEALRERGTASARQIAQDLWPDSPGWKRRTRRGAGAGAGAVGGTMPMKAASLLWKLHDAGLAGKHDSLWRALDR